MKTFHGTMKKVARMGRSAEGFSLIEAVVAIFILTVGILSAAAVIGTVANKGKFSSIVTTATHLAEEKVESLRHAQYENIADSTEDYGQIGQYLHFRRVVSVTPNADDNLKTVQVIVTHLGGQQLQLDTMIAR